ncbi:MAG: hypothetical protein RIR51_1070, partial [Bacteroidota bacterium]
PVKLMNADGSFGAALGSGVAISIFNSPEQATETIEINKIVEPQKESLSQTKDAYTKWKEEMNKII